MSPQRIWGIFVGLVLLLPLPFGGYSAWVWSLAGVIISGLILLWAFQVLKQGSTIVWRPLMWPPLILFLAVVLWILFQISGFGPPHPVWALASETLGQKLGGAISLAPQAGLVSLMRLLSYAGAFWIAFQYGRDRENAQLLLRWFVYASGAYALYGLINYVAGNEYLLWQPRHAYHDDVTGTFVNRNTYATFAGLGLLTTTAMLIQMVRKWWRQSDPTMLFLPRLIELWRGERLLYLGIAIVIAMAWLQSHSRMGFAATIVALGVLLLTGRTLPTLRSRLIGIPCVILMAWLLFGSSGGLLMERLDSTNQIDRLPIFALTSKALATAPWTGQGYGSFPSVFPMFRDTTLPNAQTYSFAHDTYLELAMEIGIPAALMLIVAVAWLAVLCLVGAYRRNRDQLVPTIAFAATILVGSHSLLDFSLQMLPVACLLAALLGIGNAQAWSPPRETRSRSQAPSYG